jgi:prepilin peptidase CpaA
MSAIPVIYVLVLVPAVMLAAFLDWRSRRIPNTLSAIIALAGLVYIGIEHSPATALTGLAQGVAVTLACTPIYMLRGLSAGDVKLISATSVWWIGAQWFIALASTAIAGAIVAIIYMYTTRDATHVPYAIAIAASTIGTVIAT